QRELAKNLVHDLTKDIAITRDIQEKISKILTNSSYEEFLPLEGLSKEPYLATNLEKGFLSFKRENKLVDLKTYGLETWEGLPTSREMPINSDFKAQALREQAKGDMAIRLENFLQVIKNFVIELKPTGERKATIELEPPSLGKIDLKIKVKEGEVEIEAQVEKHETLSQLRQELPQIKEDLESLGLKLKDFNLSLGLAAEERGNKERRDLEKMKEERDPLRENNLKDDLSERNIISFHKGRLYKIA
ncbi:MAG: flagellar hook-length control protein FliK, partial [Thermodesulfobacteriaceae bacterium]|nr:flagellar hook-length control protein FliK [Thermodesulfobacteriaceae bacterium]